jgi:hypothetical protein
MFHKQKKSWGNRGKSPGRKIADDIYMQVETLARQVLYKEHAIAHSVRRWSSSEGSAEYIAVAFITWKMPDRQRRVMHCLTLSKPYSSAAEASNAALDEATKWVDHHVLFEL